MPDMNYTIRREEWEKVVDTLDHINRTLIRLEERENARDDRVVHAQATADRALDLATSNATRLTTIEANTGHNTRAIDGWQGWVMKITGALIVAGVCGFIGFLIAGGVA